MRAIRLSRTFVDQLNELLDQGEQRFGRAIIEEKKALVYATIRKHIAYFPASRMHDPGSGLSAYPVSKTPFVLLYDYDDAELRIHFVLHKRADRNRVDPTDIEW